MWLMTTFGYFSVVQKAGTTGLTIRARVRADLDHLRARYVSGLSPTRATPKGDYQYRATISHAELAAAMVKIVADVSYDNFKSEVAHVQGHDRAHVYGDVWSALLGACRRSTTTVRDDSLKDPSASIVGRS